MIDTKWIKKFATCFGYEFRQEVSKPSVVIIGECHEPLERCCQEGFIKEFRPKYVLIEKLRALSYDPETDCIKFRDDATIVEDDLLQLKDFEDDYDYYKKMSKKYNIQLIGCDFSHGELNKLSEDLGIPSFGRGDFDDIRFDDAREKKMGEIVLNYSGSSSKLIMVIIGHWHARCDSKIHEKLKGYIDYICIWSKKAVNEVQERKKRNRD